MMTELGNLFGLSITKTSKAGDPSSAVGEPINDDGSTIVAPASGGAYYGVYMDVDGATRSDIQAIQQYRTMAGYPEVDMAIQDIVNEAIPHEDDKPQIDIVLDELEISDVLKDKITEEFKYLLTKLKYASKSSDIFRRWYVDGRMFYQIIVDKENLKRGVLELKPIDSTKIRKVKEYIKERTPQGIDIVKNIVEYYVYNESGFSNQAATAVGQSSQNSQGIKISPDAIVYVHSGILDGVGNGQLVGFLNKAIRPANQLRMLEDAVVVYRIARAPERRIFYVDVGNLPKGKAEQYVKEIMNKYRNKMVYDAKTGEVRDDKKYMSMLEDFWMPRRDGGKGTEITTLPGATNLNQLDDITYFQTKLYQALNVPISRMQPDTGFSLGRSNEISRDELKFQKFIDKLRRKFSELFFQTLKAHLILKGIVNDLEWEEISEKIHFRFQRDNFFAELKNQDVMQSRLALLQTANQFAGIYFSKEYLQRNILMLTDEELEEMQEQMDAEENDQTATIWGQMELQAPPMPPMMGGDPNDPNAQGGGDPFAQGGFPGQDDQGPPQEDETTGEDPTPGKK
jgi:hypothetical protein